MPCTANKKNLILCRIRDSRVRTACIIERCCRYLRSLLIQGAWSLVRSRDDNAIKAFYQRLALRVGSAKAIVATERRLQGKILSPPSIT
jgi:hypothetical protein